MVPVRWKEGKERGRAWPRAEVVKLLVGEMAAFLAGSSRAQSDRNREGERRVFGFIWDTGDCLVLPLWEVTAQLGVATIGNSAEVGLSLSY